jgi:hypothetical protein
MIHEVQGEDCSWIGCGLNLCGPQGFSCEAKKIYSKMKSYIIFTEKFFLAVINWAIGM